MKKKEYKIKAWQYALFALLSATVIAVATIAWIFEGISSLFQRKKRIQEE